MSGLTWLHVSDFHFGADSYEQDLVLREALIEAVERFRAQGRQPDLIFATGDIANRGKPSEYEAAGAFFNELLMAAGLVTNDPASDEPQPDRSRLFVVPGNHDVDRTKGEFLLRTLQSQAQSDAYFAPGRDFEHNAKLDAYAAWFNDYFWGIRSFARGTSCGHVEVIAIRGYRIGILPINSALFSQSKDDHGQLWVGQRPLRAALKDLTALDADLRIALWHHPSDWLSYHESANIHAALQRGVDIMLRGHLHQQAFEIRFDPSGGALHLAAGAAYQADPYPRAAVYTRIEGDQAHIFPIRYYDTPEPQWQVDPSIYHSAAGFEGTATMPSGGLRSHNDAASTSTTKSEAAGQGIPTRTQLTRYLTLLIDREGHLSPPGVDWHAGSRTTAGRYPVEQLYAPLHAHTPPESPTDIENVSAERALRADMRIPLTELAAQHHRLLLIGEAGGGKTTFLRMVAAMLARDVMREPCPADTSWRAVHLGAGGALEHDGEPRVPLFLRASVLGGELHKQGAQCEPCAERIVDELVRRSEARHDHISASQWRRLLQSGGAILLVDGLDEVAGEALRETLLAVVRDAARCWPACPLIVTSRPLGDVTLEAASFAQHRIEPFSDEAVRHFIDRWLRALHRLPIAAAMTAEAAKQRDRLNTALQGRFRVRRMAKNPVMLTCLCVVDQTRGRLPEGRAKLYRAVLRWLVDSRSEKRALLELPCGARIKHRLFVESALMRLALAMMGEPLPADLGRPQPGSAEPIEHKPLSSPKHVTIDVHEAVQVIQPVVARYYRELSEEEQRTLAALWLRFECMGSSIIEEVGRGRLRFWHLTFQEFYAALQLADLDEALRWRLLAPRLNDPQWRETVSLLPACLVEEGETRVDALLRRVVAEASTHAPLSVTAHLAGTLGNLLQPLRVYGYEPPQDVADAYARTLAAAEGMFTKAGATQLDWRTRLEAAVALGRAGDPRLAAESFVDRLLPLPGHDGVLLGKYPVTVEEYQRFFEAGGYDRRQWWDDEGWTLRTRESWTAPDAWAEQLETPNRPVIGVSWWAAQAYCLWASDQHQRIVRLPTVAEHLAAWGIGNNRYPWSADEPTEEHANFARNVKAPSPVGIYPLGDGPNGHCDLAGNVWEWCADKWVGDTKRRHIRGGSWLYPAGDLRAAVRYRCRARNRLVYLGFRVAAPRA